MVIQHVKYLATPSLNLSKFDGDGDGTHSLFFFWLCLDLTSLNHRERRRGGRRRGLKRERERHSLPLSLYLSHFLSNTENVPKLCFLFPHFQWKPCNIPHFYSFEFHSKDPSRAEIYIDDVYVYYICRLSAWKWTILSTRIKKVLDCNK